MDLKPSTGLEEAGQNITKQNKKNQRDGLPSNKMRLNCIRHPTSNNAKSWIHRLLPKTPEAKKVQM